MDNAAPIRKPQQQRRGQANDGAVRQRGCEHRPDQRRPDGRKRQEPPRRASTAPSFALTRTDAACAVTSLLTHGPEVPASNCLAHAARVARDGLDEVVFLGTPDGGASPGHVVLRDARTAGVREPGAAAGGPQVSAEDYAAPRGHGVLCAVPSSLVRRILALPARRRPAALAAFGGPLAGVAHLAFGISVPSIADPTVPKDIAKPDKDVHAWLDSLGNAVPDDQKKALSQPADDAHVLLGWVASHKPGDPKAAKDMPADVKAAQDRLLGSDAVRKQVTDGKGTVTSDALGKFVKGLDGSAKSAKGSYEAFKKDNKNADPIAKQGAVNASILQGSLPILDGAGKDSKTDQKFNADDLKAAADGKGLSDPLKNAAAFYANSGQYQALAASNADPGAKSTGTVQNSNLDALLSKGTAKNEGDSLSSLQSSAMKQVVSDAGGDAKKVGADYFEGRDTKASGADKAAALVKLSEAYGQYKAGEATWNAGKPGDPKPHEGTPDDGATPGQQRDAFDADIQKKMDKLSGDKDVQAFLGDKLPGAVQGMVNSDPKLKATMQKQFDDASSPKALQDAFAQKGKDGKPLSATDALGAFLDKPASYAQALGAKPDFSKALADAPQDIKDKVKAGYDDIASGKDIQRLRDGGKPADQAMLESAASKTLYDSVLDPKTVQEGTDEFNDTTAKLGRDQLMDGKSPDDLFKGLGVKGPDDPALQKLIEDNMDKIAPSPNDQPKAGDIVAGIRGVNDAMRHGVGFDIAMDDLKKNYPKLASEGMTDTYKTGALHGVSGVLLAGAIGANAATGKGGSAAQTTGQALQAAGLLTQGAGKYYGSTLNGLKSTLNEDKARLNAFSDRNLDYEPLKTRVDAEQKSLDKLTNAGKDVENVGKGIGGVAGNAIGLVTGALGAKQAAASGDKAGAALQGTTSGLSGIGLAGTATEIAGHVGSRVGLAGAELAGTLAGVGGAVGAVAGVAGAGLAMGVLVYSIVKDVKEDDKISKSKDAWYDQVKNNLSDVGVKVPEAGVLLSARNARASDNDALPPVGA